MNMEYSIHFTSCTLHNSDTIIYRSLFLSQNLREQPLIIPSKFLTLKPEKNKIPFHSIPILVGSPESNFYAFILFIFRVKWVPELQ